VRRSYEDFVAKQGLVFRSRDDVVLLDDLVKFGWDAVNAETGEVLGGGLEILVLDDAGRIRADYRFPG
jgi:transcription termination factor Rho